MAALDCVINYIKNNYYEEDYEIERFNRWIQLKKDENSVWNFYRDGKWEQGTNGNISLQGKWVCDELQNYKITNTLGEVFSTKTNRWNSTPQTDPNFYCVANGDRINQNKGKILRGANSYSRIADNATYIFNKDKSWIGRFKENTPSETWTESGTWKCVGDNSYEILEDNYREKYTPESGWVQIDKTFSCVYKFFNDNKKPFTFSSDKLVRVVSWGTRYFYKSKQFVDIKTIDGKSVADDSGTWECDGERNYKLISKKSGVFSSKTGEWTDGIPTSAPTEEPTYDKSKFPLKVGSRGPEVVQLQNYLNRLIPFEPLVVNGLFDKKTQDKLTQLQKSLNLIK